MRSARRISLLAVCVALTVLAASASAAAAGGVGLGRSTSRATSPRSTNPLHGRAMWIWELGLTDGGDLSRIIAGARYYRITTLIIKSSDGTSPWSQFTPQLVSELHAAHLKVCAWQYIYGNHPGVEANLGADAVKAGADCLVLDAETEYQGRYVAAQAFVRDLRKQIHARYPVALAGFPYVDYHPAFPYSVFLGPGGAQYDVPQMYWRDIGVSPTAVFAHTYAFNLPYGRPIYPLGQVYGNPPMRQVEQFRRLALQYGAEGVSWWDWQEARAREWSAVAAAPSSLPHAAATSQAAMATVGLHARGDLVVWIQEHLLSAGEPDTVDGRFGPSTEAAVEGFQAAHGLLVDGIVGPDTWAALLRYRPAAITWVRHGRQTVASSDASIGRALRTAGDGGRLRLQVPASAALPARRDEIPARPGAGQG
jgi:hypothetical protein